MSSKHVVAATNSANQIKMEIILTRNSNNRTEQKRRVRSRAVSGDVGGHVGLSLSMLGLQLSVLSNARATDGVRVYTAPRRRRMLSRRFSTSGLLQQRLHAAMRRGEVT